MTYLEEFKTEINRRNLSKFLQLWEEYSHGDTADVQEFKELLLAIKNSDFSKPFGQIVESALTLWGTIEDKEASYDILKLLIDLQSTNTPRLATLVYDTLKERYGHHPQFNERIRLVGLRTRENFQYALSYYDTLAHLEKGKSLFHPGGWGTCVVVEVSPIRQQVTLECENLAVLKHLTFEHACKALFPLADDDFRVRRFSDPDTLEAEAKKDPVGLVKLLLRDLGPKTAAEIKEELDDLVIPTKDWNKWWQNARNKLKMDPLLEVPSNMKEPFRLRTAELAHHERFSASLQHKTEADDIIEAAHQFFRDFADSTEHQELRNSLKEKLQALLGASLAHEQLLQVLLCLEHYFEVAVPGKSVEEEIRQLEDPISVINAIPIIALKKRALTLLRKYRKDSGSLFLQSLTAIKHSALRDYLFKELHLSEDKPQLEKFLNKLLIHPEQHPDFFFWYFQKVISSEEENLPLSDSKGRARLFDGFLVLLHRIEGKADYKDLVKKMYSFLTAKRYAVVRSIMGKADLAFVKEFLLLASKCHTFTDHDRQIFNSLAAVVHPELNKEEKDEDQANIIWSTEEGYRRIQERVKQIGTVEIVENAREIEAARSLGDLRENSEYKFAQEKRARLQGEMKALSDQLKRVRVLIKEDVQTDEVGVGCVVDVTDSKKHRITYTILGPWEALPEKNILSFQSKLAQAMIGYKQGDKFRFKDEEYTITAIRSYFE